MGKTIQAISFIAYTYESLGVTNQPNLIIAPKSTIPNWMREFKKWAPFLRVVNLRPVKEERNEIIKNQMKEGTFDVCVTTYDAKNIF